MSENIVLKMGERVLVLDYLEVGIDVSDIE